MKLFSNKTTKSNQMVTSAAVIALIAKDLKISSKDYINVCNLFALSSIYYKKSLKGYKMKAGGICKQLSFFDSAVRDVLKKTKNYKGQRLDTFLSPSANFNGNICSIVNKYLNYYNSDEDKYDIVISAFEDLFLTDNIKKTLVEFDGFLYDYDKETKKYINPTPIALEPYIHTLLTRAVIRFSEKLSDDYSRRKNVNPFENETEDDAFNRTVDKAIKQYSQDDELMWDRLLADVDKQFKKEFEKDKNPDRPSKVLEMLLLGYTKSEVAKAMDISSTRVGDLVWYMKKAVTDLAKRYDKDGDSTLLYEIENNFGVK